MTITLESGKCVDEKIIHGVVPSIVPTEASGIHACDKHCSLQSGCCDLTGDKGTYLKPSQLLTFIFTVISVFYTGLVSSAYPALLSVQVWSHTVLGFVLVLMAWSMCWFASLLGR